MDGKIDAAIGYAPIGGLQFIIAIINLFRKDKFIKFHALQSLAYWILVILIAVPYFMFVSWIASGSVFGLLLLMLFLFILVAAIPIYYAVEAFKGKTFYIPIVGKSIAGIVGYSQLK